MRRERADDLRRGAPDAPPDQNCTPGSGRNRVMFDFDGQPDKLRAWSYDVRSDLFKLSPGTSDMFGFSGDEVEHLTLEGFLEHVNPADRQKLIALAMQVIEGQLPGVSYRYRVRANGGRDRLVVGHAHCQFEENGKVQAVFGTVMDVTEQEQSRTNTGLANAPLALINESGTVWLWEQDDQFRFSSISRARDQNISTQHAAMLGLCRWDMPDSQPCHGTWDDHRRILEERQPFHAFEYRIGPAYFSVTGVPVFSATGKFLGYRGTGHAITALKQAEATARESEALLRLASRLGRVGAWSVDEQSMRGTWSRELLDIYEFPTDTELTSAMLYELVEPGWRDSVRATLWRCRHEGASADVEFPSLTATGRNRWLRLTAEAVRDTNGAICRVQGAVQDITDRRQDAERLRQLSDDLTATFESITDALVTVDKALRCTFANGQAERLTNLPRQALLGSSVSDVFPFLAGTLFQEEVRRVLLTGCTGQLEAHDAAAQNWFSVTLYPSAQGITVIARNTTETRSAQRDLVKSEERFRLLFETNADAIIKADLEFRIRRANTAACRMFGRSLDELQELRTVDLVSVADPRLVPMIRERLRTGGACGELTMVRADGTTFEAEVNTSSYSNTAGETFYNLVIRDATERVQLRRKLEAVNEELARRVRERTVELEGANRELKAFARSLAHDLRQPIAAAGAFANAALDELGSGNVTEAMRHARQVAVAARTMGEYVEALLSLAHVSQVTLDVEELDLSAIANSLLDQLQLQAPGRTLVRDVQPDMYVEGDVTLIRMLLQNLLSNAWKFTSRKDTAHISLRAEESADGEVVYCVRDNGAGFDMSQAGKLFRSFQRLHDSSEFAGTGVGLANAQRIVARHGGRIWADAVPGAGATFSFTLSRPTEAQSRLLSLQAEGLAGQ